jgi:multidrug resistance efflux pump
MNKFSNSRYRLGISLVNLALVCSGCQQSNAAPEVFGANPTVEQRPADDPKHQQFAGVCVLRPQKQVKVKAQTSGEVSAVHVTQGDRIRAGEILATINVDNVMLRRQRSEIDLKKLIQRAEHLKFEIARTEREFQAVNGAAGPDGYIPRYGKEMAALVERRSDLEDNLLSQAAGQIDLRTYDDQIKRAEVRAPFDGLVLSRSVEPGMIIGSVVENVGGGDVLFVIADPAKLVAECLAREADALLLVDGKNAELKVDGLPKLKIQGRVTRIAPVISNDSGISRREFLVDLGSSGSRGLLSGMNATVLINAN